MRISRFSTDISASLKTSIFILLILTGSFGMSAAQVVEEKAEAPIRFEAKQTRPVSIVIEEGQAASEVLVGYLKGTTAKRSKEAKIAVGDIDMPAATDGVTGITFTIVNGGGMLFESSKSMVNSSRPVNGQVLLPLIKAGREGDEGIVRVLAAGRPIVNDIRIATVAAGGMASVRSYFAQGDPAVIKLSEHFAIIDESKLLELPEDSVTEEFSEDGTPIAGRLFGLCIRVAWGPGKVKYDGFSPWAVGQRYSYKPENSNPLVRGSGSGDDVDAIYRYIWGCGTALKVPDSCTVTIRSDGSRSYCCNAAMAAIGHTVKWVTPSAHGFPNCPLSPY